MSNIETINLFWTLLSARIAPLAGSQQPDGGQTTDNPHGGKNE
jgi:hypothetical protein